MRRVDYPPTMVSRALLLVALVMSFGCGDDDSTPFDSGPLDTGVDASSDASTDTSIDVAVDSEPAPDVGVDAPTDAPVDAALDAGPICGADSCGDLTCGRSACGYPCGECAEGSHCTIAGTCSDIAPPGELCLDAWGAGVVEGGMGYRSCDSDDGSVQLCTCSGGGPDAWFGCGDCERLVIAGPRGARCLSDDQCEGALPCHPSIRLCGETCDRGTPDDACPLGTLCGIPGDVAGVCLSECATCGGDECDDGFECAPGEDGNVCVPAAYPWPTCP